MQACSVRSADDCCSLIVSGDCFGRRWPSRSYVLVRLVFGGWNRPAVFRDGISLY